MKEAKKPLFFIILCIILVFSIVTFTGLPGLYSPYIKGAGDIRWGIDIRGGVDVTFLPPEGYPATEVEMAAAEQIIKVRLVNQNITDYEVYTDTEKCRIIVRFPWKENETDFDPENAIKELGETALLTFREGTDFDTQESGNIIMQGQDVVKASAITIPDDMGINQPAVSLELSKDGTAKFSDATGRLVGEVISIWLDDTLLSAPTVETQISDGNAVITGDFTSDEAKELADKINAGALPFKLFTENFNTISPTLGGGAKDAMVTAGLIAFVLVCLFMILYYRVSGLVAAIVLLGQISLIIASVTGFFPQIPSFTLTLPGIAGIILSIGMGVDANVITSERIIEELRAGRTIAGAIDAGYHRAFSAIVDGNVTTLIVAAILMGAFGPPGSLFNTILKPVFAVFGPSTAGNIYSFGYTLFMGVLFNMFMGVFVSRWMLESLTKFSFCRNLKLFRVKEQKYRFNFSRNAVKYFMISALCLLIVCSSTFFMGIQLDIQFQGGTIVTYAFDGDIDTELFQSTASGLLRAEVNAQRSANLASGTEAIVLSMPGTQSLSQEEMTAFSESLREIFADHNVRPLQINNVDPVIGREFLGKCVTAVVVALVLMMLYVAVRFRRIGGFSAGAMGVVALIHDCIIVSGVFILLRIPLNDNYIAVLLTILGYSINDTIIVYDRIRENKALSRGKVSIGTLVSNSINQTLSRSINTSLTTVISMLVVTVMAVIYNVQSIITFAFPLLIGLIAGAYSSICIAGPLWIKWQERKTPKIPIADNNGGS